MDMLMGIKRYRGKRLSKEAMNQKNENGLFVVFCIWILIWSFCFGMVLYFGLENSNSKLKSKIEIEIKISKPKMNSKIENEITAYGIQIENSNPVFYLSESEWKTVAAMVAGESGNQNYDGKWAVASCIFNACIKDGLQPSEVRKVYQYSGWVDWAEWKNQNPKLAQEVEDAIEQVFILGNVLSPDILWFYNPNLVSSSFHESQRYYFTIGDHDFFGPWN